MTILRVYNDMESIEHKIITIDEKIKFLKIAIENTPIDTEELVLDFHNLKSSLLLIKRKVFGMNLKQKLEKKSPTFLIELEWLVRGFLLPMVQRNYT